MFRWDPIVFIRYTLWLMLGILLGRWADLYIANAQIWLATGFIAYALGFFFIPKKQKKHVTTGFGLLAGCLLALFGNFSTGAQLPEQQEGHIWHLNETTKAYKAQLTAPLVEKANSFGGVLEVSQVKTAEGWQPAHGKIQVYFKKNDPQNLPVYRQWLLVKAAPQVIAPPANPGEFDYRAFLANKGIHFRQFIRAEDFQKLTIDQHWSLQAMAYEVRDNAVEVFTRYIPSAEERGVAIALVLGVKDQLDYELRDAYAGTGAMHVLAVSGLHVGILLILFQFLLRIFGKDAKEKAWAQALVLLLLWSYALVTGFAPSVLRATTMFSVVVIGKMLNRRGNIYNTLAVSAFLLLILQPNLLFEVGFQLSYLAVFGIVYLHPRLMMLWQPQNVVLYKVWESSAVAIAAQIATTPIGLYYFHQFPNYFLLSNIFVIWTATFSVYGGVALLLASWLPWLATIFGFFVKWTITFQNFALKAIVALPGAVFKEVPLSLAETWLLYALLGSLLVLWASRHFSWVYVACMLMVAFLGSQWQNHYRMGQQQALWVFSTGKSMVLGMNESANLLLLGDTDFLEDQKKMGFHLSGYCMENTVSVQKTALDAGPVGGLPVSATSSGNQLLFWKGKQLLMVKNGNLLPSEAQHAEILLLASKVKKLPWEALNKEAVLLIHPKMPYYLRNRLQSKAKEKGFRVHDLALEGAFLVNWQD